MLLHLFKSGRHQMLSVISGCLCLSAAYAGGEEAVPVPFTLFPTTPGVSLYGLGGNGWTATGDVMAPLAGRPLNFTYVDPQIYYHNNPDDYTVSAGLGQRWLTERVGILGVYVFGDYNHLNNGDHFWFVSPGIERLGEVLDFSVNGYIPVSKQRFNNDIVFADQLGNFNNITFAGHTQYDQLVQTFDSTGWGLDGEIGVHLPIYGVKLYLGGYYFSPKDNSTVGGGAARLEVPVNRYLSAVLSEAYDSEFHNTLKAGVTLWFGGRQTGYHWNGDLATRIVDPIQRNLVATAGGARSAQPVVSGTENVGTGVEVTNISFFVPGSGLLLKSSDLMADSIVAGAVGDGTYENPYQGMTQPNVDDGNAQNNRIFYINSGSYQAQYNSAVNPDFIVLNNDFLFGRTNGFKQEAFGGSRPLILFSHSGFEAPQGDTIDSLNDLQLSGSGSGAGIFVNHDLSTPTGDFLSIPDMSVNVNGLTISQFGDGIDVMNGFSSNLVGNPPRGLGNASVSVTNSFIINNTGVGGAVTLPTHFTEGAAGGIAGVNFGNQLTLNIYRATIANNAFNTVDFLAAAGGISVVNEVSSGPLFLNVTGSMIANNALPTCSTSPCGNTFSAVGGIAAVNNPFLFFAQTNNPLIINVTWSQISNQTILNSSADVVGGIAMTIYSGELRLTTESSQVIDNVVNTSFSVAGGISTGSFSRDFLVVNIWNSTISGNNASGANTDGGISMWDIIDGTTGSLNVNNSVISNNVGSNSPGIGIVAGGIAVRHDSTPLRAINVTGSKISGNSGSNADVIGGIAEKGFGLSRVTVVDSVISNNDGRNSADNGGGVAVEGSGATILINNSIVSNNLGTGVYTGGGQVTLDRSIVFGNTRALDVNSGTGRIEVTNPVFFDGVVTFSGGGIITFPNVTPSNGQTVVCPFLAGACYIQ